MRSSVTKFNNVNANTNALGGPDPRGCHNIDPYQTTIRGSVTYTIPRVDVLVSAVVRSQPPLQLTAGWQVPNTVIQTALGHLPVGTTANSTTTIQLTENSNKLFVDNRRTQIDIRFAKVLRFGGTRSDIGIDLNNLLNTNYAAGYNTTYIYTTDNTPRAGGWGVPTSIFTPRFVRINYTINF